MNLLDPQLPLRVLAVLRILCFVFAVVVCFVFVVTWTVGSLALYQLNDNKVQNTVGMDATEPAGPCEDALATNGHIKDYMVDAGVGGDKNTKAKSARTRYKKPEGAKTPAKKAKKKAPKPKVGIFTGL